MKKAIHYIATYFSVAFGVSVGLTIMKCNGDIGIGWFAVTAPLWIPVAVGLSVVALLAFAVVVWAGCSYKSIREEEALYE